LVGPRVCVCVALAPPEGESFDVVVLRFALGPLGAAERHAAAAGACRVLRPGGRPGGVKVGEGAW